MECRRAFGCIDGTHKHIKRPIENLQDYYNYKKILLLKCSKAVCDSRGRFIDTECKWPGSVHDAKVFANLAVNMNFRDNLLPTTYSIPLSGQDPIPNYLIGDPAYPLSLYSMKEYQSCSSNSEVIFDNLLRSARNQVECSFGRFKARWLDLKLEPVPVVVYCCFVFQVRRNFEVITKRFIHKFKGINAMKKKNQIALMHFILTLIQKDRKYAKW